MLKDKIILKPVFRIVQKTEQIFPLGMKIVNKEYEFGGGWGGDTESDGVSFKNLQSKKYIKIDINCVKNIKILVYIHKYNDKVSKYEIKNMKDQIITRKLHKNDIVYFGYQYNSIKPPILDFKIVITN